MKRIFGILVSAAVLISMAFFVSCNDDSSSSVDEDYYYTAGVGDNTTSDGTETDLGNGSSDEDGNISGGGQTFVTIPSAPKNVTAKAASSSSIKVSWDAVDAADSYIVYYRPSLEIGNEPYSKNGSETVKTTTSTSISIQGLEYKMYFFWVTAKNSAGESRESSFTCSYPSYSTTSSGGSSSESGSSSTTTTLSAPTGLTATASSSSSIKLSWNSVSGATEYQVYYSEYSYSSSASLLGSRTLTSITITGLKANTKYYFWVKATNGAITSDYSSYAYATTQLAGGTLTVINNSSYAVKNVQMYTTYEFSLSGVLLGLDVVISPGYSQTFQNITPGTYVRLGSETYRNHKVSSYKTVIVQSGTTTVLTITDSDIISN